MSTQLRTSIFLLPATPSDLIISTIDDLKSDHTDTSFYPYVWSTHRKTPDRNGNIIDMEGWLTDEFMANPVILSKHNLLDWPVGRAERLWRTTDEMLVIVSFAPTNQGREIEQLVASGYLKGISAGALPVTFDWIRNESGFPTGMHLHTQRLVELSIVPVPAAPDTLLQPQINSASSFDRLPTVEQFIAQHTDAITMATAIKQLRQKLGG